MAGEVGQAFVRVTPIVTDFRGQVAAAVNSSLPRGGVSVPVTPAIARGSAVTWETIGGAAIARSVPLPVTPTISPGAKAAFGKEVGGLRGLLLGAGQFGASRALGISGPAAALFGFAIAGTKAVKVAADLEQELSVFQQVSGATADQMERVREEARQLGADITLPAVSAGDAAATMTQLAKAGLSVDEVLAGTRGTLQLAAAANLDFASSAELAASALNAFELPGSQAVKVADLLAGAANAAQGDISSFGIALAQAAAVAHQAGISVEDTTVLLTLLAKAGIQGSDAGTSLRTTLLRLIAPGSAARKIFAELGIEINDAQGNVRVDVFEQLRQSLARLEPATRNQALALLFGSDAVRAAAVFTRNGAKGFDELATSVERSGQAAEAAEARTSGFLGSVSGLSSNLETLGTTLGTVALPVLTAFVDEMSAGVTKANNFATSVVAVGKKVGGIDTGRFGTLGDAVEKLGKSFARAAVEGLPFVAVSNAIIDRVQPVLDLLKDGETFAPPKVSASGTDAFGLKAFTKVSLADPQLAKAMAEASRNLGKDFTKGVADGILTDQERAVRAARKTLAQVITEGQTAVADAIKAGKVAVEAAAVDAKQNLTQIGTELAQQAAQLIDTGPLGQKIAQLQAKLDSSRTGDQKRTLTRSLRDAKAELERAEASIKAAPGQKLSAEQQAELDRFLAPFKEKVKDAQAALGEFTTEGVIAKLQKQAERQKQIVVRSIADLIARFNAGQIGITAVNTGIGEALQKNVGPFRTAGHAQGFAFRQAFAAQLAALKAQAAAIILGPQTRKTGAEPKVVSPAQAAAQAAADVEAAQKAATDRTVAATSAVAAAVRAQHKAEEAALGGVKELLAQIRDSLQGKPTPPRVGGNPRPRSSGGSRR